MNYQYAAFADEADSRLEYQIRAMKENGVSLLEIRGVDGQNIADMNLQKAKEVRKILDDAGIAVWSIGSPYGKTGIQEEFESQLEQIKHGLELAEVLGAGHIRLFSFYVPSGNEEAYFEPVVSRLEQFCTAAKNSGVVLCHENEKGIYGDTASRCLKLLKAVPELRAIFDPANFIQCGQDTLEAWELLAPYVEYMHIKDALPDGSVVPAGYGIGNIPQILREYRGQVLTIEPHLTVFRGMEQLEKQQKTPAGRFVYPSSMDAFSAAVISLKKITESIRKNELQETIKSTTDN